jgi:hypothetical protein
MWEMGTEKKKEKWICMMGTEERILTEERIGQI